MTPCLGELLESYAQEALPSDDRGAVEAHLSVCEGCRREVQWLRAEHRAFSERARLDPPALKMKAVRRDLMKRIQPVEQRFLWRQRLLGASRTLVSAGAAVVLAFVFASRPISPTESEAIAAFGSGCMSMEVSGFCAPPSETHELVAAIEQAYDACLLATPRSGPGGSNVCW